MMDLSTKLSGPCTGDLVVNCYVSTITVAKACMWRFVESQKNEVCVNETLPDLVEVSMRQVTSSKSDFAANGKICNAAQVAGIFSGDG